MAHSLCLGTRKSLRQFFCKFRHVSEPRTDVVAGILGLLAIILNEMYYYSYKIVYCKFLLQTLSQCKKNRYFINANKREMDRCEVTKAKRSLKLKRLTP